MIFIIGTLLALLNITIHTLITDFKNWQQDVSEIAAWLSVKAMY